MIQGPDTRRHLPSLLAISSTTCPRPYPDTGRTGQEAVATTVGDPAQLLDVHVDQIPPVWRVRSGRVWVWPAAGIWWNTAQTSPTMVS